MPNRNTHVKLLKALTERDAINQDASRLRTAKSYVERAIDCIQSGACRFKGFSPQSALDHASTVLTWGGSLVKAEAAEDMQAMLPEGIEIPEHTAKLMIHKLTSNKEDRDKDVLHTGGAILDPKSPLLWQHMHPLPVGKVLTIIEQSDVMLRCASVLLDLNDLTSDIAKLIDADVLRFSHGFRALEFNQRKDDGDGEDMMGGGFDITKFEIMEASLVSVPSNTDAEMEVFSKGKFKSDFVKAVAKGTLSQRPAQGKGATFTTEAAGVATIWHPDYAKGFELAEGFEINELDDEGNETGRTVVMTAPRCETAAAAAETESPETSPNETNEQVGKSCGCDNKSPETITGAIPATKQRLSNKNRDKLQEVADDLAEMMDQEKLSRAGTTQCRKCIKMIKEIIAEGNDGGDNEDTDKPAKAAPAEATKPTWKEIKAAALLADEDERRELLEGLKAMAGTDEVNRQAAVLRRVMQDA